MRLARLMSPTCTESKSEVMEYFLATGSESGKGLPEGGDRRLVAGIAHRLPDAARRHEPGGGKGGKMGGDGRLRQAAALEAAGADPHVERVNLPGEMRCRLLQPGQHIPPHRMRQRPEDRIAIDLAIFIVHSRYVYRNVAI